MVPKSQSETVNQINVENTKKEKRKTNNMKHYTKKYKLSNTNPT
jgi:hypothetical protein